MCKIPVFLSLSQIHDILPELDKKLGQLHHHIEQQTNQYGFDCEAEQLWWHSLNDAKTALNTAKESFTEVRQEPIDTESLIQKAVEKFNSIQKAQQRIRRINDSQ